MSEVTGNLGSESIRLRGMALQVTQESILKELEDQTRALEILAKTSGKSEDYVKEKIRKTKEEIKTSDDHIETMGKSSKSLEALSKVFKTAGAVIGGVAGTLAENIRMTRGFDSNINNASYSLQYLASTSKGAMRHFYKMGADTVNQLSEQAEVYKRLSNIGGVTGSEFSKMRERAAEMGLTMQSYTGLMEENFLNLRIGGNSARTAMNNLTVSTKSMREGGTELNNQFLQLGIDAQDYGQMILQNSMLMGGLAKTQSTYGSNTGAFNQKMLDTTRSITALSDAFGFNREQVMKAANDALKTGRNRTMYENIKDVGKEQMLALMTGLFGGDAQKGLEATIAAYTGRFTQFTGTLASVAPDFLDNMKTLAAELNKSPKDLKGALEKSGLGPMFARLSSQQRDLVESTYLQSGAIGDVVDAIVNANAMFKDEGSALARSMERSKKPIDKQLESYGALTRENINMAVIASKTNEALNDFGIGLALMGQVMALSLMKVLGSGITALSGNEDIKALLNKLNELSIKGASRVNDFETDAMGRAIVDGIVNGVKEVIPTTTTGGGEATGKLGNVYGGSKKIKVQGTETTVDRMLELAKEATAGGTTTMAIKQLIGLMAMEDSRLNISATSDLHPRTDPSHREGRAVDFNIEGLRDPKKYPQDSKGWADKADEVRAMLRSKGLKDTGKGKNFTVIDEANFPTPNTTGPHIHVNFTPEGAAEFEKQMRSVPISDLGPGGASTAVSAKNFTPRSQEVMPMDSDVVASGSGATQYSVDGSSQGVNTGNRTTSSVVVSLDQSSVDAIVNGIGRYHSGSAVVISNALTDASRLALNGQFPAMG